MLLYRLVVVVRDPFGSGSTGQVCVCVCVNGWVGVCVWCVYVRVVFVFQ